MAPGGSGVGGVWTMVLARASEMLAHASEVLRRRQNAIRPAVPPPLCRLRYVRARRIALRCAHAAERSLSPPLSCLCLSAVEPRARPRRRALPRCPHRRLTLARIDVAWR